MMFETLSRVMSPSSMLKLRCDACGHQAAFNHRQAFACFGADASPYEVREKARCSARGVKGKVTASI